MLIPCGVPDSKLQCRSEWKSLFLLKVTLTKDCFVMITVVFQDPYFMKNHLGSYECKLCLTLHNNEVSSYFSSYTHTYYISKLVHVLWLVNLAGGILLHGPLIFKIVFIAKLLHDLSPNFLNLPYLFPYNPSNFCNKLNWEQVKSHQNRGFGL